MKKKILKSDMDVKGSKQGICPVCGNNQLEYGESGIEEILGEKYYYKWKCKCGTKGTEWYDLKFNTQHIDVLPLKNIILKGE